MPNKNDSPSYKIVFTFDARAKATLEQVKADGDFASLAETVRQALSLYRAIQRHGKEGFTEIRLHDPVTDRTRTLAPQRSPLSDEEFGRMNRA